MANEIIFIFTIAVIYFLFLLIGYILIKFIKNQYEILKIELKQELIKELLKIRGKK